MNLWTQLKQQLLQIIQRKRKNWKPWRFYFHLGFFQKKPQVSYLYIDVLKEQPISSQASNMFLYF